MLSRDEVIGMIRSSLPHISSEAIRTLETYTLEEIVEIGQYFRL